MNLPANPWPTLSFHQRIIVILSALCFLGAIVLGAMVLAVHARLQAGDAGSALIAVIPARDCRPSTLTFGTTLFFIRDLDREASNSLEVPRGGPGIAYRVEGTGGTSVFVLSPRPENLAVVLTVPLHSRVMVTWSDCTFSTYRVSAHEPGTYHASDADEPSDNGLKVYFPLDASGAGFVFTADLTDEAAYLLPRPALVGQNMVPAAANATVLPAGQVTVTPQIATAPALPSPTPPANASTPLAEHAAPAPGETLILPSDGEAPASPDSREVLAEIGLLEVTTSPDGKYILLEVSIYNFGGSAFTLSASDISLTQPNGQTLAMARSEPSLPKQIARSATETFTLTFPHPSSPTATLKLLTVEYDIEDD